MLVGTWYTTELALKMSGRKINCLINKAKIYTKRKRKNRALYSTQVKKKKNRNSITIIKSMKGKNHKMKLTPKV